MPKLLRFWLKSNARDRYFKYQGGMNMNESELNNIQFKTWLDYHKLEQNSEPFVSKDGNNSNGHLKNDQSHISLNQILENIPLAYSPITKQLHVLTPKVHQSPLLDSSHQLVGKGEEYDHYNDNIDLRGQKAFDSSYKSHPLEKKTASQACSKNLNFEADNLKLCQIRDQGSDHSDYGNDTYTKNDDSSLQTEKSTFSEVSSDSNTENSTFKNPYVCISMKLNALDRDDLSIKSSCSRDSEFIYNENSKFFENGSAKERKRKGLSALLSGNLFHWNPTSSLSHQGWKIFGKNPVHEINLDPQNEGQSSIKSSPSSVKKYEDVIASSSALILHNRPDNLPAKSQDEQQRHKLEYQRIVEAARKKEIKESKKKKKQLQQQLKFEEELTNALKVWNCQILPKWEVMKNAKKTRDLWWIGLPPSIRGKIWKLAVGNELNITHQLYEICAARAKERLKNVELPLEGFTANDANKESSVELIQLDISRTFPQLCIFQKGGPYYDILHCLLGAYVCYRPDVGYVQGMSFIAAILILNLEPVDAFICFANLLNRPCHLAFFTLNQSFMNAYYNTYNGFFKENLPKLCQHFQESCLTPDLYLLDWVYSVFAKAMPLDIACRVWDVFLRDGEEFIFRTALGILHLHQDKLMKLDFINGAQFLRKLPDDLSADLLFKSIDSIKMCIGKVKFGQVLANFVEKCSLR